MAFVLPFIGLGSLFENIILNLIWFNIGSILEILGIVKLLEGSSELLAEKLVCSGNDESIEYRIKAEKYIVIYSIVVVLSNINFIFMGNSIGFITGVVALITKLWIMFSLKKLSKY